MDFEQKLTAAELAELFGVHRVTIERWCKRRAFPHRRTLGGRMRFSPSRVLAYLREHELDVPDELVRHVEGATRRG